MIDRLTAQGLRSHRRAGRLSTPPRRGHKLQAGLSGIIGEAFREMVKDRTYSALESRAKAGRPTGGRAYGYRDSKIDRGEAFMVLEIFGKFAEGISARSIAADLNARRIPSPGASWNRAAASSEGMDGLRIRVIVRNERYRGVVHWNTSEWRKDPDTGKRKRVMRPRAEWVSSVDESLRIVSDDLWARAQHRIRPPKDGKRIRIRRQTEVSAVRPSRVRYLRRALHDHRPAQLWLLQLPRWPGVLQLQSAFVATEPKPCSSTRSARTCSRPSGSSAWRRKCRLRICRAPARDFRRGWRNDRRSCRS